ncbi:MAG: TonB-dependent receptor [Bacteroidales bacterium]|nr:TonB-dependent receptor [Bacteroidales bacterium]
MSILKRLLILLPLMVFGLVLQAQQLTISGKVTDASGETLPGVSIQVKGTQMGTVTDVTGKYTLQAGSDAVLIFSFIGMKSQEVALAGRTTLNVRLEPLATQLDEVVVVGYGSTKKMDLTGSVTTIKSDKIANQSVANIGQALQGKVAGVQVTQSGAPGSSPIIRIRGLGTVNSSADPLYVVDGVLTNDISFLSPTDIESTTILKDASASAIYGIRASNGVIIINTRRSKSTEPTMTYQGYVGFQNTVNQLQLANNSQYIELVNQKNQLQADAQGNTYDPLNPADFPVNTNWYDEIMRSGAFTQNHDIGFSGGSGKSLYYFGVGYYQQEGLLNNQDYQRLNLRSTLDMQTKEYLKIGYSATLSGFKTTDAPSAFYQAYTTPPVFAPKQNDTTFTDPTPLGLGNFPNPAATMYYYNSNSNGLRLVGNVYAEINFLKHFQFRSSYGTDLGYARNRSYSPYYQVSPTQTDTSRTLSRAWTYNYKGVWDNTLTFENTFGDHRVKAMAGMAAQEERGLGLNGSNNGVMDYGDQSLYLGLGGEDGKSVGDWGYKKTALSYFGRVNYSFRDRYLFTGTLRYDGSSVFPVNDRWDLFPSVGLGWIITGEKFMANQKIFDFLKLRASWGVNGNNNIPANVYKLTIAQGGELSTAFGQGGNVVIAEGANITSAVPPTLKWEKLNEIDIAIEGMSFNNKLSYEVDFYSRTTKDAIFPLTLSATAGTSGSYLTNNADIRNTGVEFTLGWTDSIGQLAYSLNLNYALNHNEVVALAPGTIGIYGGNLPVGGFFSTYTELGEPIGYYYGRNVIGIFQTQEEVENYVNSQGEMLQPAAKPGDFKYEDVDGNGVIDNKDRVNMGSAIPTSSLGFSASLAYKGFDFSFDLYARWGNKIYNAKRAQRLGNENYDLDFYENHWTGAGSTNENPSADLTGDNMLPNTWYIEDGSFLKVRSIQLGYSLPASLTNKIGMNRMRFYVNAANPFTLFGYNGFTPEIASSSATSQGIDLNVYPMSATYTFGVNVTL